MILAKNGLRTACIYAGINQKELGEKVGLNHTTISLIINGRIGTSPKSAMVICKTLKKNFDDLFEITDRAQQLRS